MLIIFDKNVDPNILSVISGDVIGEMLVWSTESGNALTVDKTNYHIRSGADDATVHFANAESMEPYLNQVFAINGRHNPIADGVDYDGHYDRPKTGQIVSHTYIDTDVEQDLIDGL